MQGLEHRPQHGLHPRFHTWLSHTVSETCLLASGDQPDHHIHSQTNVKSNDGYVLSQPLSPTIKSGLTDTSDYILALQYQFFPPPNKTDSTGFISFQYLDPHGKYTEIGYLEDSPDGKWHQYRNTFNGFPSDTNSSLVIVVQVSLDQSQPVHGGIANLDNVTISKTPDPRCPKS